MYSSSILTRRLRQPVARFVRNAAALTEEQQRLVKATAPVLAEHGVTITKTFYQNMFAAHPELKNIFNMAHQRSGAQPQALAHAVFAYAANIDNLGALTAAVSRIGHKHASLLVEPEQYAIVGKELLGAVKQVLKDGIDDKTVAAWQAAYAQLADILIDFERNLYYEAAQQPGGWSGWRSFKVVERRQETNEITSFLLKPADGKSIPAFKPGQFISIKRFVPSLGYYQPRQYSLSNSPNQDCFRITVKREAEASFPAGTISSLLHDQVQIGDALDVSPPMGDFFLDLDASHPVVLISGGVGLTPMLSMLSTMLEQASQTSRPVVFLHGTRSASTHAMKDFLADVSAKNANRLKSAVWYEDATGAASSSAVPVHAGRIKLEAVKETVLLPDAHYFICGPVPFMSDMMNQLKTLGVSPDRLHSEVFGSDAR